MFDSHKSTDYPNHHQIINDLRFEAPPSNVTVKDLRGKYLRMELPTFYESMPRTNEKGHYAPLF